MSLLTPKICEEVFSSTDVLDNGDQEMFPALHTVDILVIIGGPCPKVVQLLLGPILATMRQEPLKIHLYSIVELSRKCQQRLLVINQFMDILQYSLTISTPVSM
jgi:hypothetical protein